MTYIFASFCFFVLFNNNFTEKQSTSPGFELGSSELNVNTLTTVQTLAVISPDLGINLLLNCMLLIVLRFHEVMATPLKATRVGVGDGNIKPNVDPSNYKLQVTCLSFIEQTTTLSSLRSQSSFVERIVWSSSQGTSSSKSKKEIGKIAFSKTPPNLSKL